MPLSVKRKGEYINEEDYTEDEAKVVASFEKHIKLMVADDWYITLNMSADIGDVPMETEASPEYRKAEIDIDFKQIKGQWGYLDYYVRHELIHVLVWSFFDIAGTLAYKNAKDALIKLEESVIDRLEHMPLWDKLYKE